MKRINNLYSEIISLENLRLADKVARKGKKGNTSVQQHIRNADANLLQLHELLKAERFTTSEYRVFTVFENKERTIHSLPYYPDRIVHHAIMNVLEPIFIRTFTNDTYGSIKGRGLHLAANKLRRALRDECGTQYCLKLDIKKFYPSVNNDILKSQLRRKIKDAKLLRLLDNIIDSAKGLPIGNYMSQYLSNFYLSSFDHYVKEILKVKHYFRYVDDIVILASTKQELHETLYKLKSYLQEILKLKSYLQEILKLKIRDNYQVFPVKSRGIDFLGYVFFHSHIKIRKSIKQRFAKMLFTSINEASLAAYNGWLKSYLQEILKLKIRENYSIT